MRHDLSYPLILQPGQLKAINDHLISVLGTPVFFVCDDLARPHPTTAYGRFYDVVTGLYVVYQDCGIKLFSSYLTFCEEKTFKGQYDARAVAAHIKAVKHLRGALCHGELCDGQHVQDLLRDAGYYLGRSSPWKWPEFMSELTETQCDQILIKLVKDSDKLVSYLKTCAGQIAADEEKLKQWRNTLVNDALNPDMPKYGFSSGRATSYFDKRIVSDLDARIKGRGESRPYQTALKSWLEALKPKLLAGEIADSAELYRTLLKALDELYHPSTIQTTRSSVRIIMGDLL